MGKAPKPVEAKVKDTKSESKSKEVEIKEADPKEAVSFFNLIVFERYFEEKERIWLDERVEPIQPVFHVIAFMANTAIKILSTDSAIEVLTDMAVKIMKDLRRPVHDVDPSNRSAVRNWVELYFIARVRREFPVVCINDQMSKEMLGVTNKLAFDNNGWHQALTLHLNGTFIEYLLAYAEQVIQRNACRDLYEEFLFGFTMVMVHELGGHMFMAHVQHPHKLNTPDSMRPDQIATEEYVSGEAGHHLENELFGGVFSWDPTRPSIQLIKPSADPKVDPKANPKDNPQLVDRCDIARSTMKQVLSNEDLTFPWAIAGTKTVLKRTVIPEAQLERLSGSASSRSTTEETRVFDKPRIMWGKANPYCIRNHPGAAIYKIPEIPDTKVELIETKSGSKLETPTAELLRKTKALQMEDPKSRQRSLDRRSTPSSHPGSATGSQRSGSADSKGESPKPTTQSRKPAPKPASGLGKATKK